MSVQSFVNSAKILYANGKYEESLCLICIAMDACASKQYSEGKNATRYKKFLKEHFSTICKYGFLGIEASSIRIKVNVPSVALKTDKDGYVDMEQIIYHVRTVGIVVGC